MIKWQNISLTRYFYFKARNPRRIGILIITVWVVSLGISLAPQLGWKDPDYLVRIAQGTCLVSQDPAYQVSASGELWANPKYLINIRDWELRSYIRRNRESVNTSRNVTWNFELHHNSWITSCRFSSFRNYNRNVQNILREINLHFLSSHERYL